MDAVRGAQCSRCGARLRARVRGPLAVFIEESICERCTHPAAAIARSDPRPTMTV